MNVRQAILQTLATDFNKITTANGYNYDINAVYKKFKSIGEVTEFPAIWFGLNGEDSEAIDEKKSILKTTLEILVVGYISVAEFDIDTNATLSDEAEKFIQDFKSLIQQYKSNSTALNSITGILNWNVKSVEPYLDDKNNIGEVHCSIEVQYLENASTNLIDTTEPNAPTLSTPSNGGTVTTLYPQLDWTGGINDIGYHIQVSTDNTFGTLIINQNYLLYGSYTIPLDKVLTNGSIYYWRVRAFNQYGYSNWTSARSFTATSTAIVPLNWNNISSAISWWNSYSSTGVAISSGVSAMLDQINTRNLTQTVVANRPSLSGNAWNSLSSIYFNPTFASESDHLSYNDSVSAFKWTNSNTGSLILVMMSDGTNFDYNASNFCPLSRSNTNFGAEYSLVRGVNTGPGSYQLGYPFPSGDYRTISLSLNVPHQIIITHSGSASTIYYDGANIGTLNKSIPVLGTDANSFLVLGAYYNATANFGSGRYTGHIFEVGNASANLTSAQVEGLYAGFRNRFNI
jgi:hypothetical protein